MTTARYAPDPIAPAIVPVRSPRTSIVLAELTRQRRLERRQRRAKRQRRCRAWTHWLAVLGRGPLELDRVQSPQTPCFTAATPRIGAV